MKKEIVTAGFVLFSVILPLKAYAVTFDKFFVFGDSLSDQGNAFNATEGQLPPSPPYSNGRFSNGNIWVDYLGKDLGLTPTPVTELGKTGNGSQGINFAFGGATSGQDNSFIPTQPGVLPTGVQAQVQDFLGSGQKADPNALYAVWGGGNDYLFGNVSDPNTVVSNLSNEVRSLALAGAKNILVFNLPDLGKIPYAIANNISAPLTNLSALHNAELASSLNNLSSTLNANIIPVDINSLFNRVEANPAEFGFQNITNSCLVGDFNAIAAGKFSLCNDPNDFLFFDGVHPTTNAQKLVADTAFSAIEAQSVPESSTALGILAIGTLGATGLLKRKQKSLVNAQKSHGINVSRPKTFVLLKKDDGKLQ